MPTIILQLDPTQLINPDLDIRYKLPDLLVERCAGRLSDDGYDYVGDHQPPCLQLFLAADDPSAVIPEILQLLRAERVLGNDLSQVPVAVEHGGEFRVVYPPNFGGRFWQSDGK